MRPSALLYNQIVVSNWYLLSLKELKASRANLLMINCRLLVLDLLAKIIFHTINKSPVLLEPTSNVEFRVKIAYQEVA